MDSAVAWGRYVAAAVIVAAVMHDMIAAIVGGSFVVWNFFGYFTIQNNLVGAALLVLAARVTGKPRPAWLEHARLFWTVYLSIVAVVYWTLLYGNVDDPAVPWANVVLHGVSAVVMIADWLLEGPRRVLVFPGLWVITAYPMVWLAVVLVRGATDGWVPYPFLDPDTGYGSIAAYVVAIAAVLIVLAPLTARLTRWRPVAAS